MPPPEFEQSISADGDPDQRSAADIGIIHHAGNVAGVFLHGGRTLADARISVPAQIRQNDAVARGQLLSHGQPEFMIRRKGMQQNYRRAFAQHAVDDLGVAASDLPKGDTLHQGI